MLDSIFGETVVIVDMDTCKIIARSSGEDVLHPFDPANTDTIICNLDKIATRIFTNSGVVVYVLSNMRVSLIAAFIRS